MATAFRVQPDVELTRDGAHHAMIQRALRDAKKNRFRDPDRQPALAGVWVVYGWSPKLRDWALAGFHRSRHVKLSTVRRLRKKLRVPAHVVVRIVPLADAARNVGVPTLS